MIFAADAHGKLTYICAEWPAYVGQSRVETYRDGWTRPVVDSDREFVTGTLAAAAQAQAAFSIRFRIRCADGSV